MDRVRLGKSGMEVSRFGFGGIPIQRLGEDEAVKVVRRALDLGVDWIDTANGYSTSEERIGMALRHYDRERIRIFTKSGSRDAEGLKDHVELSLKRLRVGYLDLFQFHGISDMRSWEKIQKEGAFDAARRYRDKGVIRHIGITSHKIDPMLAEMDHPEIEVVQFPFNFIVHDISIRAYEKAVDKDIGFIAMKPVGGGVIPDIELCIRYLLQFPHAAPDPGFETAREVEEIVRFAGHAGELTPEEKKGMERARADLGRGFCRRCEYCSPCQYGVDIVPVMNMDSMIRRLPMQGLLNPEGWIAKAVESVEKCTECGECEKKCPYDLPIMTTIRANAEKFRGLPDG